MGFWVSYYGNEAEFHKSQQTAENMGLIPRALFG